MQFLKIPNIKLDADKEKEVIEAVKNKCVQLETYYKPIYNKIKEIRSAKNCKNYEGTLFPVFLGENELTQNKEQNQDNRPNIHIPALKNVANVGIAEIREGLFSNDFLTFVPVDPNDYHYVDSLVKAFNYVREETRTDEEERKIIENIWWEGTCPVYITNEGRINAVHEIANSYEVDIPQELIPQLQTIYQQDIGTKIFYKEEEIELDGEKFKGVKLATDTGFELGRTTDNPDTGESALNQAINMLSEIGINHDDSKIVGQDLLTSEEWIDGLPRPKILDLINTYIDPYALNDNPDTVGWVYWDYKRTQEIVDNPNFISDNTAKLVETNGTLKGKTNIDTKDISSYLTTTGNFTSQDPAVNFKQAYFEFFKFKDGTILRNIIVSTAEDEYLLECKPNMSYNRLNNKAISKNPLIIFTYYKQSGDNIGTSPAFDSIDLSKTLNILTNYALDELSRNGNRYIMDVNSIDRKTFNGGTAEIIEVDLEQVKSLGVRSVNDVFDVIQGNVSDSVNVLQASGMFKDAIQQLSNTSSPYFNSKAIQTATEVATIQSSASGIVKSILIHVGKTECDVVQRMLDDLIERGIKVDLVPDFDEKTNTHSFATFNFGDLKGKKFIPKITSINPELSKQIVANSIEKLLTLALQSQNPEILSRVNISEFMQEWLKNVGLNKPELTRNDEEAQQWLQQNDMKEQLYAQYQQQQALQQKLAQSAQPNQQQGGVGVPAMQGGGVSTQM